MKVAMFLVTAISAIIVLMAMYPQLHDYVGFTDTTGMLPLNAAVITALPYFIIFVFGYAIVRLSRK
jgi:uncharacterized protein with PQ loop repeat